MGDEDGDAVKRNSLMPAQFDSFNESHCHERIGSAFGGFGGGGGGLVQSVGLKVYYLIDGADRNRFNDSTGKYEDQIGITLWDTPDVPLWLDAWYSRDQFSGLQEFTLDAPLLLLRTDAFNEQMQSLGIDGHPVRPDPAILFRSIDEEFRSEYVIKAGSIPIDTWENPPLPLSGGRGDYVLQMMEHSIKYRRNIDYGPDFGRTFAFRQHRFLISTPGPDIGSIVDHEWYEPPDDQYPHWHSRSTFGGGWPGSSINTRGLLQGQRTRWNGTDWVSELEHGGTVTGRDPIQFVTPGQDGGGSAGNPWNTPDIDNNEFVIDPQTGERLSSEEFAGTIRGYDVLDTYDLLSADPWQDDIIASGVLANGFVSIPREMRQELRGLGYKPAGVAQFMVIYSVGSAFTRYTCYLMEHEPSRRYRHVWFRLTLPNHDVQPYYIADAYAFGSLGMSKADADRMIPNRVHTAFTPLDSINTMISAGGK